ncbi:MAG: hypothetical protein F4X38_07420 [Acidimicrobiaceae bacterium]|nr:hypothetical protein [Acidimicrobiaceae bacterium]
MTRTTRSKYDFTLETRGRSVVDDEVVDALYEAGCDDAGIGRFLGVHYLEFNREAGSYCEAVRTAIEDVQSVPGVSVTRVVNEDTSAGDAFTAAVNAALSSPARCPDVPGTQEQTELRRIWEMATKTPSDSVSGAAS